MPLGRVVIAGASLAGLRATEALRRLGYDGDITIVGDELEYPYDRPPLSKQVLSGAWEQDRALLVVQGETEDLDADWRLGIAATGLDLADRSVQLANGTTVGYDGLIIATGARARHLPGTEGVPGVHVLRTLNDSLALRAELEAGPKRVVVVGAGFIGAEVAATARKLDLAVTMVEPLETPLARAMPAKIGEVVAGLHRGHGVDVRLGVGVDRVAVGDDGRASGVVLSDGATINASVVVVGIGVIPNTEWLDESGLTIGNGVVCDETCMAAPDVVAAGDVARWPNPRYGEVMRVEHWDHAADQAEYAAQRLLAWDVDEPVEPYAPVPWFWSDQYDRKIQFAGHSSANDDIVVIDGSLEDRRFVALFGRGGKVVGVLGMNRPAPVMRWRNRIVDGATWDDALAAASDAQ
ncbi:MAG: FAD-dependent oxidoreductase [Acidimicrobiales bacterium]